MKEKTIQMNENVKGDYEVFISVKKEVSDMKACISHMCPGWCKLLEKEDGDNVIIIMKKDEVKKNSQ